MIMARFSALPLMVVMISLISHSSAYVFYVGGSKGWVPDSSESYNNWAQRMRFQVNDSLVFRYNKESDSVLVVSNDAYNSCNTSNPIQNYEDGNSEFKFDRSGPFFFISGAPGNCEKGQKLTVVVLAVRNNKGQITPAPKPSPPSSPPSSSPSPTASPTSPPVPPSSPPNAPLAPSPVSLPPSSPPTVSLAPSPVSLPPSSPPTASLAPSPLISLPPSSSPAVPPSTSPVPSSSSPSSPPTSSLAPSPSTPVASSPSGRSPTSSPVSGPPSPPGPPPSISPSGSNPASGGSSGNETSPPSHAPPSASWASALFIGFASMLLAFLGSF